MPYTSSPQIDLELKASELPPGCTAPLCAPADGRLVENGKVILLRLVRLRAGEFVHYARWDERNALVLQGIKPHIWRNKPTPQKLERIAEQFVLWRFAAVHPLPRIQNEQPVVALNHSLHPFSPHPTDYVLASSDLKFTIGIEAIFDRNHPEIESLMASLEEPKNFANFAWRWLSCTNDERDDLWKSEFKRRGELKDLLRWILQSHGEIWQRADRIHVECDSLNWVESWFYNVSPQANDYLPMSDFTQSWTDFLASGFEPIYLKELQSHLFPQATYEPLDYSERVATPTAHEQLDELSPN